jgi:hypothetical protein
MNDILLNLTSPNFLMTYWGYGQLLLKLLASTTATNTYRAPMSGYVSLHHLLEFGCDKYSHFFFPDEEKHGR